MLKLNSNNKCYGLVTIQIGSGTIVTGTFEAIDWSTGTYYIKQKQTP